MSTPTIDAHGPGTVLYTMDDLGNLTAWIVQRDGSLKQTISGVRR